MTWFRCQNGNGGGGGGNYTDTAWDGSLIPNTRIDTLTGLEVSTTGYGATDFVYLGASTTLYRCGDISNAGYNAFYDSNKTYITGFYGGMDTTIPLNAKYARLSDVSPMGGKIFTRSEGGGIVTPTFSSTTLVDNSSLASSFTFSEDYHNYDFVRVKVFYSGTNKDLYVLTTPSSIDLAFNIASHINFNFPYTNWYCCYSQNNLTWTRYANRNCDITEIVGLNCTNATVTETEIYKATALSSSAIDVTTQLDLFDFDMILFTANSYDSTEVQPNANVYQTVYGMLNDALFSFYPYNSLTEVSIENHYISASKYAYIVGIKFT